MEPVSVPGWLRVAWPDSCGAERSGTALALRAQKVSSPDLGPEPWPLHQRSSMTFP